MIIFDNHLHLRRNGRFIEAIKDFKNAGGTHFVLCQYPMISIVLKEKSYKNCYIQTLKMADEIKTEINSGLNNSEIENRQLEYGYNELPKIRKSLWKVYLAPIFNFLIIILKFREVSLYYSEIEHRQSLLSLSYLLIQSL